MGIASLTLLALLLGQIVPVNGQAQNEPPANGQAPSEQPPTVDQPSPQPAATPSPGDRPILRIGSEGEPVSELQAMLKLLGYYSGTVDGVYREDTAAAVASFQQAVGLQADGVVGPDTWNSLLPPSPPAAVATTPGTVPPANSGGTSFPSPSVSPTPSASSPTPTPTPAPVATPTPTPTPSPAPPAPEATPPSPEETTLEETVPEGTSSEEPLLVDLPILRLGTRGPAVERLQDRLKALGFFDGPVDGIFGEATQSAVQAAQRNFDLEPDGVVGPATWSVLLQ